MSQSDALPALPEDVSISDQGGSCPVQITGEVQGLPFYFRARGQYWSVGIGGDPVDEPRWFLGARYPGGPFDAGHMSLTEARGFLNEALTRFLSGAPGNADAYSAERELDDAVRFSSSIDQLLQDENPDIRRRARRMRSLLETARVRGLLPFTERPLPQSDPENPGTADSNS